MSVTQSVQTSSSKRWRTAAWVGGLAIVLAGATWFAMRARSSAVVDSEAHAESHEHGDEAHDHEHEHSHPGHDESTAIEVSPQAQRNIGLKVAEVDFQPYDRTISLPAIVVERPGRSRISVPAPMTGVITKIYPLLGQAITTGEPLFELRLTHEELVQAQSDFLRTLEEADVVQREIARLQALADSGAIAGKTLLERQYELQKLVATNRAQDQALILHGLTTAQVESIKRDRRLLGAVTVVAPAPAGDANEEDGPVCMLQLQELNVEVGQHVTAGDMLCVLADHCKLYIEGQAFEQDARPLDEAAKQKRRVSALVDLGDGRTETIPNLQILTLGNQVDIETRTFPFHVILPNELVRDEEADDGRRFVGWRFKPGQRVQVLVPVDAWHDRIVLPIAAVVQEGPESYVFVKNGDHFDRRPIHVEYRDQQSVVLAKDEENLWPGDSVAVSGAQQLQLALKNKAGGGIDPHAGHSH